MYSRSCKLAFHVFCYLLVGVLLYTPFHQSPLQSAGHYATSSSIGEDKAEKNQLIATVFEAEQKQLKDSFTDLQEK